jgi:uncharacterized repeat protein (TIGR03806 family)|tara:strand:+ start:264 stop:1301 length:1038 start_codon:yes stop_codon:yes gene_type:complete
MNYLSRRVLSTLILSTCIFGENPLKYAKPKLSDYGFFVGNMADHVPKAGVIPYDVSAQLFSDYALKSRFIVLPKGEKLDYQPDGTFDFPIGSTLIKTFYYPADFRQLTNNIRLIETRLLIHTPDGWLGFPYVWNEKQTEAVLEIAGERVESSFLNENGEQVSFNYSVPNFNQCKGCHVNQNKMIPIGPKVRLLNHDFYYQDGAMNQLEKWTALEMINGLPDLSSLPHTPDYSNLSDGSIAGRARSWIDINCAHCHRLGAPGETSGLLLNIEETNLTKLGVFKPPVAAGRGSGNRLHTIVPGKPNESIMIYRMESRDPGIMMPELGRKLVDKEGVELVRAWIKNMK